MSLTLALDPDKYQLKTKYLSQESFTSKIIAWKHAEKSGI